MRPSRAILALCLFLFLGPVAAQEGEITYKTTEVAPGLYMLEGEGGFAGGNIGLSVGEDGVVLIDDGMPPLTDKLLAAITTVTDDPVSFVVNTHAHGDHVGGNELLGQKGATIVAHENLRQRMIDDGMPSPDGPVPTPKDALPVLTFNDQVTFHLNGRRAVVFHVPHAHTDGDSMIHFPDDNVIHAGDVLFNGLFPFIDIDSGGSLDGFVAAQQKILSLADDETTIIAGHGSLAKRADVMASIAMLEDGRDKIAALIKAGKSEEEILEANPLSGYHDDWNWGFITTERMTKTFYRALSGGE
jgi:glyoxylase-like metal-dependent hydrolase (beta-lactamase superfamily II)